MSVHGMIANARKPNASIATLNGIILVLILCTRWSPTLSRDVLDLPWAAAGAGARRWCFYSLCGLCLSVGPSPKPSQRPSCA